MTNPVNPHHHFIRQAVTLAVSFFAFKKMFQRAQQQMSMMDETTRRTQERIDALAEQLSQVEEATKRQHEPPGIIIENRLIDAPEKELIEVGCYPAEPADSVQWSSCSTVVLQATLPITIYLSDESAHEQVEAAIEALVVASGGHIEHRDDPVLGSWFRRIWAKVDVFMYSPLGHEMKDSAAHAAESRVVHTRDATNTATMLQNLGPVLVALQPTKEAAIRVGALLIVKRDDSTLVVVQLTSAQQLKLDHQPQLAQSPCDILTALAQSADGVNGARGSTTAHRPLNGNPVPPRILSIEDEA